MRSTRLPLECQDWLLCRSCHRRKTRQDRSLAKFLAACSLDWYSDKSLLRRNRRWR